MSNPIGPSSRPDGDAIGQLIEVATWFYLHGWSQVRIAKAMDLDPSTVSRYLKRARDEGIVRIEIQRPPSVQADLGRSLADRFSLSRAIVVTGSATDPIEPVAVAAAEQVDALLRSGLRLGVSWGRTLAGVVRHLRPGTVSRLRIVQLAGGVDESAPGIQGHDLVRALSGLYPGSQTRYLHAPAIVDSLAIRDALLSDSGLQAVLEEAARSELALVGIGSMDVGATLVSGRHISPEDGLRLLRMAAVGNMNTRFFDTHGQPAGDLDDRTIAISWEQLAAIPTVVAVAAGREKAAAVAAGLRTSCIDILVTDDAIARVLLEA